MSKYRLKSSRAILKRFKITSRGKCLRHKANRNHLLQKKASLRKQKLRKVVGVKFVDLPLLKSAFLSFK